MDSDLHPYVVFLPVEQKTKILSAIFGSKASVDILRFSLAQGISNKIFQKDLVRKLDYSNKTIIENLKSLTSLGVVEECMEKIEGNTRITWVKTYRLTDSGRWFALLLAEDRYLSDAEKAGILQSLFRTYIRWVRDLSDKLKVSRTRLKTIFNEEMK